MPMNRAVYPGTFDPITLGHEDIVRRAARLFDSVVVGVADSRSKRPFFTLDERVQMAQEALAQYSNVKVVGFSGLLMTFIRDHEARVILRGLRAVSDFEYEFQMALMNRKLNREVQTVFLMTGLRWIFTSSSIIKEAARFGGNIADMVPPVVYGRLREKLGPDRGGPR